MEIKFYSTPGCYYCKQLKELFERANISEYEEIPATSDELREACPNARAFPWVIIDGKEVGGIVDTAKFFLEKGFVLSKKNA